MHWWDRLEPVNARLRAHFFSASDGRGSARIFPGGNYWRGVNAVYPIAIMKKLVTALFLCCALALAQSHPAVAIHNAKIVTVSGPVINKGTVVVRNGLIEAVGEDVTVPADAMLVEGEGLTVYPGLIDALSTWGQPGGAPAAAATAGRGGRDRKSVV